MSATLTSASPAVMIRSVRRLYQDFGRRVREARRAAGLTQDGLAARVGLSRTSITNIERGNQHIPLHMLFRLAAAVGLEPEQLLPSEKALIEDALVPEKLLRGWEEETSDWMKAIVSVVSSGDQQKEQP